MIKSLLPELLMGFDWARLKLSPIYYGKGVAHGAGEPVILIPGALAGDCSLLEMRLWLGRIGYRAYNSGIGRMVDCPDVMRDKLIETIDRAYQETGKPVTLIGHSLGGMIARGAALKRPDKVKLVIMLASPFRRPNAHPFVMKMIGLVHGRALKRHIKRTENSCLKCFLETMCQQLPYGMAKAAIYTKTDPVVAWEDCITLNATHNYEVSGTHVGLSVNREVYQIIAGLLGGIA